MPDSRPSYRPVFPIVQIADQAMLQRMNGKLNASFL